MSLAIIMIGDALKSNKLARSVAAAMYLNTMKYNVANTSHNTIVKLFAAKYQNTMTKSIANHAKNGYVIKNAAMFANIITNTLAAMQIAQLPAPPTTAVDKLNKYLYAEA